MKLAEVTRACRTAASMSSGLLGDFRARLRRMVPGERVIVRHGAVERLLRFRTALDLELHRAEAGEMVVAGLCDRHG